MFDRKSARHMSRNFFLNSLDNTNLLQRKRLSFITGRLFDRTEKKKNFQDLNTKILFFYGLGYMVKLIKQML